MNPPSAVLAGGVHGKVCWLIAYIRGFKSIEKISGLDLLATATQEHVNLQRENCNNSEHVLQY